MGLMGWANGGAAIRVDERVDWLIRLLKNVEDVGIVERKLSSFPSTIPLSPDRVTKGVGCAEGPLQNTTWSRMKPNDKSRLPERSCAGRSNVAFPVVMRFHASVHLPSSPSTKCSSIAAPILKLPSPNP